MCLPIKQAGRVCALAARAMEGMAVHSDGPGRGAEFTLEFPLKAG